MAGFDDLVAASQPALMGGGCTSSGTEGATWRWPFTDLVDFQGDPIDLRPTADVIGVAKIVVGSVDVVDLDVEGTLGGFILTADTATTDGLADGNLDGRQCEWLVYFEEDGSPDKRAFIWTRDNSPFLIKAGA